MGWRAKYVKLVEWSLLEKQMMRDEGFDVTGRCRSHSGNIVGNALTS
jgi:hypothetical protein